MNIFNLSYLKGFFKRNKKFLLIPLVIFVVGFIVGSLLGFIVSGGEEVLYNSISGISNPAYLSPLSLFIHNFLTDMLILVSGLLFSVLSVIIVLLNGWNAGLVFGFDVKMFVFGVLPHAITEYIAVILCLTGAFILTKLELDIIRALIKKERTVKAVLKENKIVFNDLILILVTVFVLVVISALIEGWLTPVLIVAGV